MAQIDRLGLCDIAEYERVAANRMKDGDFTDGEILMVLMRLANRNDALKAPAQVTIVSQAMGELVLDIVLLNEDLRPPQGGIPSSGRVTDGVWNAIDADKAICLVDITTGRLIARAFDGVFEKYNDGLDMRLFEGELVGASASANVDLGSFRV